jgi:hypothetical protein
MKYKIFCDESNHLYNDKSDLMLIGGIVCPNDQVEYVNRFIKHLKHKYNANCELKWTKLNSHKKEFYKELLEFFFSRIDLRFNVQVVINKSNLNHEKYNEGEADNFYYKMYYYAVMPFLNTSSSFNIFMDYKDSKGGQRAKKLREVIQNTFYGQINFDFTIIHSHESQIMQLVDLLIGAIGYKNRKDIDKNSEIKNFVVEKIEELSGFVLCDATPQWESKFRIFQFRPRRCFSVW